MAIKAAWETAKGLGRAYLKYQKGKVRKGPLGYIDAVEKDILKTHEPGSKWVKERNPIPTMKKVAKTAIAAPIVVTGAVKGTEKIKKKLKESKDKKHQRKGPSGKK
jgi:hypothetical protein